MTILRLLAALLSVPWWSQVALAQIQDAPVTVNRIEHFDSEKAARPVFGKFRFIGGLVLHSTNPHLGSISGLRIKTGGEFITVADTGFWFRGKIERNASGIPTGISNGQIAPILGTDGKPFTRKWSADIEGLTIAADGVYASAEMDMRVLRFAPGRDLLLTHSERITGKISSVNLKSAFSFEAIATLPKDHPLAPALLVLAESDQSGAGQAPAFILKDRQIEPLKVQQSGGYLITDADFLPGGDLLVLERRFTVGAGPAMRIRQVKGEQIAPGALLDGETLLETSANHIIDNMEALSVFTGPNGNIRIGLMSDDNHWLMQRTLYLEFVLLP